MNFLEQKHSSSETPVFNACAEHVKKNKNINSF